MTLQEIQLRRAELEHRLKKVPPGSKEEDSIRAQLHELDSLRSEPTDEATSGPAGGNNFNSGEGNMNIAIGQGTAIQHHYYGPTQVQDSSVSSAPEKKVFEEIEHLVVQNKVLEAIELLRSVPEYRLPAINFSRRWQAIRDRQHKQLLTEEQAEVEVNKIVDALLEIFATGEGSEQSADGGSQPRDSSSKSIDSGRDYFENVGGDVYTGPITIHSIHYQAKTKK